MSTTFCNDTDLLNVSGFTKVDSGVNTAELVDQVAKIDYHVCNKMGSSIPTIFARMFLFSSAYTDITRLESKDEFKGKAHNKAVDLESGVEYQSVYHHLISEHLDMMEFLFMYGKDVQVERWKFSDEYNELLPTDKYETQEDQGLVNLANAIDAAIDDTPKLQGDKNMEILLFKYKAEYVGGTSPDFIVFTNPNWKDAIKQNGWNFDGLFSDKPRALHQRSLPFRKLLTMLAYGGFLSQEELGLGEFYNYIIENDQNDYDREIKEWWKETKEGHVGPTKTWVGEEIAKIATPLEWKDDTGPQEVMAGVGAAKIPIYCQSANLSFDTQYRIAPTNEKWANEKVNGNDVTLSVAPMLIVENGIPNARYYEREAWNNSYAIPQYAILQNQYLSQREVPGKKGTLSPIITIDDLLEKDIVELAYIVDSKNFFTGCAENFSFMLPLKRMYFRFFTFDDLKNNLKITLERNRDNEVQAVCVSLTIPMADQKVGKHVIKRRYVYPKSEKSSFNIVSCRKNNEAFNMGIFPFFKTGNPLLDQYCIMLGETSTKVKCWKGNFDDAEYLTERESADREQINFTLRSQREALKTSFAEVKGSFDYLEIEAKNSNHCTRGMFIPLMKDLIDREETNDWCYAVDFGTSNTHVVMAKKNVIKQECKPFAYDVKDQQMVTLSLQDKSRFPAFDNDCIREFVPEVFGNSGVLSFPIRSVIYEKNTTSERKTLFNVRNVGFNFKQEVSASNFVSNHYVSDLKWNIESHAMFGSRVNDFCKQLLWMLRNHSLMNGGTERIKLAVTYPLAMSPQQLKSIKNAWWNAWKALIDSENGLDPSCFKIESVAPYKYSVETDDTTINRQDAYVNVDIGGGSTDMLYYKEIPGKHAKSLAFSVFFAANDIWGSGISPMNKCEKVNGFITNLQKGLNQEQNCKIDAYKDIANNAADVVTYLFSKQCSHTMEWDDNHFADTVSGSELGCVLAVHFAALMYYLGNILKLENLDTPKLINFTGMGSKYIEIISTSNEQIQDIVRAVFKHVGLKDADAIKVKIAKHPKEVTAIGALYMLAPDTKAVERPTPKTVYCIDGEENFNDPLKYEDTESEDCRNRTIAKMDDFVKLLKDGSFVNAIRSTGLYYSYGVLEKNGFDNSSFESSYITMTDVFRNMSDEDKREKLKDAPFFWTLKDTLYKVAKRIADTKKY